MMNVVSNAHACLLEDALRNIFEYKLAFKHTFELAFSPPFKAQWALIDAL